MNVLNLLFSIFTVFEAECHKVRVRVEQGTIVGIRRLTVFDGNVYFAFYGVPYAEAPVRELRFKNPKKMKNWKRAIDATMEYRGACPQAHIVHKHALYGNEDCLHLNIYTPNIPKSGDKLKAALVWIHGYAFTSSFSQLHGPDFFIDNNLIVVTVNHRIGAFGFAKLNNSDTHTNMGLKDIVVALKWIKQNLKSFGGDKNQLTLMGSGSAATLISMLLTTKYNNLFSKLILHSGSMFSPALLQKDHVSEERKLRKELKKLEMKDLEYASTRYIIRASSKIYSKKEIIDYQRPLIPFLPIIDAKLKKTLFLKTPSEYYETGDKSQKAKPILMGFNSQESIPEVIPFLHDARLLNLMTNSFKFIVPFHDGCIHKYGSQAYIQVANQIKKTYFNVTISESSLGMFLKYVSDLHVYPILKFAKTHYKKLENNIYLYKFNYEGNFNAFKATSTAESSVKVKGASSGDEICYLFNCEPLVDVYVKVNKDENHRDRVFIKKITELWSNFVKHGDPTPPNFKGEIVWPPLSANKYNMLLIGSKFRKIEPRKEEEMFSFWNDIYEEYFNTKTCHKSYHGEL